MNSHPENGQQKLAGSSASQPHPDEWVTIGEIVGAFGIKGEVKVHPLTDVPDRFEHLTTIYIGEQHTAWNVAGVRTHKHHLLLTLEGLTGISTAEDMRGSAIRLPLDEIAPLPTDQFYLHDAIGLTVRHVDGHTLGTVVDVIPGTASELFVIKPTNGGEDVLMPVVKAFVARLDVAAGEVIVSPIPGLFDDQYEEA